MLFSLYCDRFLDLESKTTPAQLGPGVYETSPPMGNHAQQKAPFGTRTSRDQLLLNHTDAPPPGTYNPKLESLAVTVTSTMKSNSNRDIFHPSSNPGPADYELTTKPKIQPLNRMKKLPTPKLPSGYVGQDVACFKDVNGELVPVKIERRKPEELGPGTYDPHPSASLALMKNLDRWVERRVFPQSESFPGPGAYSVEEKDHKIPMKIGGIGRRAVKPRDDPDEYLGLVTWTEGAMETNAVFKGRDERIAFVPNTLTPGPGAYPRAQEVRRSAGDGFGVKAERKTFVPLNNNPGPGTYNVKNQPWVKGSHTTTAKAIDRDPPERAPGPGHYRLVRSWGSEGITSVFTSKARRTDYRGNGVPGPGHYVPRITDSDHTVPPSIRDSRFEKVGDWIACQMNDVPGPGTYEPVLPPCGSKGRSISSLCLIPSRDTGPGPGAYDIVHGSLIKKSNNAFMRK